MIHSRLDYQNRIIDKANIIPEDEPVFLLRSSDIFMVDMLRDYASQLMTEGLDNMADSIFEHIKKVKEYQLTHPPKFPTVPGIEDHE